MLRIPATVSVCTTLAVLACAAATPLRADPAAFDLAGPTLEVTVSRGATTLPAARVPNLVAGDRVWIRADLPEAQAAHYLLVATFLRGSTNPPPKDWFTRCETWESKCAHEGLKLTVPKEAQQLMVFLAPETGGDYSTLMNAVRGRPGLFVRTSQDLDQATLDRSRLEAYLAAVRSLSDAEPERLKEAAPLLARSLAIKVEEKCLAKIAVLQAPCLMEGRESLILNDGHSASIAQELTSGPASDLAMEASSTPQLRSGYYGPFIGSIFDIARILDSFHTAQYQYIPALASADGQRLQLTLNAPPSFHNPKSVLVVALPAVEAPHFPPLRAVDPQQLYCARRNPLVLAADGAPLMFSTAYAHDLTLRVQARDGAPIELPARADASQGGFVIDTGALAAAGMPDTTRATLHGYWGFDRYDGPSFQLVNARQQPFRLAAGEEAALIVGRQDTIHVEAGSVSCVEKVALQVAGAVQKVEWKSVRPDALEAKLPLQAVAPGDLTLLISQYGDAQPQRLALHAFAEAGHPESFALHAGDASGVLRGTRLDEVAGLSFKGLDFVPGALTSSAGHDELVMTVAGNADAGALKAGDAASARVSLKDGRALEFAVTVEAARPSATLIGKSARLPASGRDGEIQLASADEVPQDSPFAFSLRAHTPAAFAYDEKVEVATVDGSSSAVLGVGAGGLTLQNPKVAVATLDPAKSLGPSAYGPLRFRRVSNGVSGDWQPLATLVRLPRLNGIECPPSAEEACRLSGSNLFLLESVSGDAQFSQPTQVPDGFTGQTLPVRRPTAGRLYVKLRDDPAVVNTVPFAVPPPPSAAPEPAPASPAPAEPAPQPKALPPPQPAAARPADASAARAADPQAAPHS